MTWQDILGHDEIREQFRRSAAAGRLASTYLFIGPSGIGKRTFAIQLARSLLCETVAEQALDACGHCAACQQVTAGTHPDLEVLGRPADRSFIPLEFLIGDESHRMQEGLCHWISLKPFCGGRKIAIIDDADYLNQEGANCLLKTLEEPPPKSLIILIGTSEQRQLPTIRSRSQIVRFRPLSRDQVKQLLQQTGSAATDDEARELSELSGGSLAQAVTYADPAVREFRRRWLEYLASGHEGPFAFAKELSAFVDAAGKEAPPRRARLKQVAQMSVNFFQTMLHVAHDHRAAADSDLARSLDAAIQKQPIDPESVAGQLERCLDVESQVDANANQATLIESWLDDLAANRVGGD